jgi:co-chaperonin GroES (HSP10)
MTMTIKTISFDTRHIANILGQYGGSPIKVGEDEYSLFRDHELLAKINE